MEATEATGAGPARHETYEARIDELAQDFVRDKDDRIGLLAALAREILEDGRKLQAERRPKAEAARPWIPYTELVELTELGNVYPTAIVAHVYEEQTGEDRHPNARALRYVGSKTYVPTKAADDGR